MMKITLPILILTMLLLSSCNKENPEGKLSNPVYFLFNGQIGTNDNSTVVSMDDNLIICGNSDGKISLLKISKSGEEIWRKDLSAGNMSSGDALVNIENGDLFVCGKTYRNWDASKIDILLVRTNAEGDTVWTKTYGGIDEEYGKNIIKTSDGNLLIAGKTDSFGAGPFGDIYLIKVNYDGDAIWTRVYASPGQEVPYCLTETMNGEYIVTGTKDSDDPRGLYLLKVNANGVKLWDKTIGAGLWKWGFSTLELPNTDLIICGEHTFSHYSQILVLKTDNQGNPIWEKDFGEDYLSENGKSIKQNLDGTFTITGSSYDVNTTQDDIVVLKIDQDGNQSWFKRFGSSETDWGINLIKDTNDDNIITGDYDGSIFMTRLDKNGNFK
jgi:hypothetical protein